MIWIKNQNAVSKIDFEARAKNKTVMSVFAGHFETETNTDWYMVLTIQC